MKFLKKFIAAILSISILTSATGVYALGDDYSDGFIIWDNISDYVSDIYIDKTLTKEQIMQMGISNLLNDEDIMIELLKKTLESIDPYCSFMTYEEYQQYIASINGVMYGLGVILEQRDDGVYITGFVEGNLAQEAGFSEGDKIYEVEGVNVEGKSIDEVRALVMGELDTKVSITVERNSQYLTLMGTRCAINTATVTGGILKGNVGYMKILTFGENTEKEVRQMLDTFQSSDVKKLIIDLRNNVGGLLSSAVAISKMLVPKGKIIDVKYRVESGNRSYYSELERTYYDTILLVNQNTASSSEIFASAMKESGGAKLYGVTTYGKGVIQGTYSLNNGSMLKVTTGEYITRNGNKINGTGIEPDVYIENEKEAIDVGSYTKFTFTDKWCVGQRGEPVKAAKERLSMLGYYVGNTQSTLFDASLQDAIKAYQSVSGLSASGILDIPTQVRLEGTFSSLEKEVDIQLQKAYEAFGGSVEDLY